MAIKYLDWMITMGYDSINIHKHNRIFKRSITNINIDVKNEFIINLNDFIINSKNINYLPNGLQKIYGYYVKYNSYLPYTLQTIVFNKYINYINLNKLPYSINIIQLTFYQTKFNLINLNNNLNIYINIFDIFNENYCQYNDYINSYFTKMNTQYSHIIHLHNMK